MFNWPKAILFDFDGVIVHSEPLHFQGFKEVLAEINIDLDEADYYREMIGFDDRGAFSFIFEKHERPLDAGGLQELINRKTELVQLMVEQGRFHALPGVDGFVRALCRHYPLAICSGALKSEIEAMLRGIHLRECFNIITAAEDVKVGKPDPEGYLLTARLMSQRTGQQITPADCLIIEDAPTVVRSVKAAGFRVLAVATTYPAEKLKDAHYVTKTLELTEVQHAIPQLQIPPLQVPRV